MFCRWNLLRRATKFPLLKPTSRAHVQICKWPGQCAYLTLVSFFIVHFRFRLKWTVGWVGQFFLGGGRKWICLERRNIQNSYSFDCINYREMQRFGGHLIKACCGYWTNTAERVVMNRNGLFVLASPYRAAFGQKSFKPSLVAYI